MNEMSSRVFNLIYFLGRDYSLKACEINKNSFEPLRWAAIMTGLSTDFVGMKEKIKLGKKFKVCFHSFVLL